MYHLPSVDGLYIKYRKLNISTMLFYKYFSIVNIFQQNCLFIFNFMNIALNNNNNN